MRWCCDGIVNVRRPWRRPTWRHMKGIGHPCNKDVEAFSASYFRRGAMVSRQLKGNVLGVFAARLGLYLAHCRCALQALRVDFMVTFGASADNHTVPAARGDKRAMIHESACSCPSTWLRPSKTGQGTKTPLQSNNGCHIRSEAPRRLRLAYQILRFDRRTRTAMGGESRLDQENRDPGSLCDRRFNRRSVARFWAPTSLDPPDSHNFGHNRQRKRSVM